MSFVGDKWQNMPFLGKTHNSVPVPKVVVSVPIGQRQSGIGTDASSNPIFVPLALLNFIFVHRLFKDPNKGLMGVQIRMKLSEKRTVPPRLGEASLHLGEIR